MVDLEKVKACFSGARLDERRGRKHKGLLVVGVVEKRAEEYLVKAKKNLEVCDLYREQGFDYKVPEEWFYTMYYCALAVLARFGVESRSQRCTACFLRYVKGKGLIQYDDEFIDRITVYSDKDELSDVDERELARYGSSVKSEEISGKYDFMMGACRRCISQCEAVVFSEGDFVVPVEVLG